MVNEDDDFFLYEPDPKREKKTHCSKCDGPVEPGYGDGVGCPECDAPLEQVRKKKKTEESASHQICNFHANRREIVEAGLMPGTSDGSDGDESGAAPSRDENDEPYSVGEDVVTTEEGETFQGKIASIDDAGRIKVSFGDKKPSQERDYENKELGRIASTMEAGGVDAENYWKQQADGGGQWSKDGTPMGLAKRFAAQPTGSLSQQQRGNQQQQRGNQQQTPGKPRDKRMSSAEMTARYKAQQQQQRQPQQQQQNNA